MRKFAIFLLLTLCCTFLGGGIASSAFAVSSDYTGALEDLQQDPDFDVGQYPIIVGDRTIDVIQIAEGARGELYVYVYQHGGDIVTVSSINICQDAPEMSERHWYNYKLTKINLEGAIGKYRVENITLRQELLRYYDITSIYRQPFDDEATSVAVNVGTHLTSATLPNGNITEEIPYEIARCYMAVTVDGEVQYAEQHTKVVPITNKLCGSIRYSNGFTLYQSSCDSWWVAFSCDDYTIDQLYEADVDFVWEDWAFSRNGIGMGSSWKTDEGSKTVTVVYTDIASNPAQGLFGHKYTWNRIESADAFLKNNLTEDTKSAFVSNGYQWVLRFYESDYGNFQGGK